MSKPFLRLLRHKSKWWCSQPLCLQKWRVSAVSSWEIHLRFSLIMKASSLCMDSSSITSNLKRMKRSRNWLIYSIHFSSIRSLSSWRVLNAH